MWLKHFLNKKAVSLCLKVSCLNESASAKEILKPANSDLKIVFFSGVVKSKCVGLISLIFCQITFSSTILAPNPIALTPLSKHSS